MQDTVNLEDSQQNAFVQSWLSGYCEKYEVTSPEPTADAILSYDHFQYVIETIQETYNYQDHEARKTAVATGGDIDATLRVLGKLMEIVPRDNPSGVWDSLNLAYAFVNATKANAVRENKTPGNS